MYDLKGKIKYYFSLLLLPNMQWSGLLTKWLQSSVTLKCCMCTLVAVWMRVLRRRQSWQPTNGCHFPAPHLCSRAALFLIRSDQSGRTLVNPSHPTHPHHHPLQWGQQPHLHGPTEHSCQMNITVPFCFSLSIPDSFLPLTLLFFSPVSTVSSC